MTRPWRFFDTTSKGSAARATLQWIADQPAVKASLPLRKLLADHIKGFWVWHRWANQYGFAFLASSPDLVAHEEILRNVVTAGYREQLGAEISHFQIEQLNP